MFTEEEKTEWRDAHDTSARPVIDGEYEYMLKGSSAVILRPCIGGIWRNLSTGGTFYTLPGDRWRGLKTRH